ncbi:phosphotransferase [Streptomyces sp. NPDC058891]|uniref:phosphotransferase n=1 Tax=Streptomyces sp. NPDC058891 TaxID=3346667 RepID=UPI003685B180
MAALAERAARPPPERAHRGGAPVSWPVEWTTESLRALPTTPYLIAIHGDLVPSNVHVVDAAGPAAILDFGSFPKAGDPALEAAVTAAIWRHVRTRRGAPHGRADQPPLPRPPSAWSSTACRRSPRPVASGPRRCRPDRSARRAAQTTADWQTGWSPRSASHGSEQVLAEGVPKA